MWLDLDLDLNVIISVLKRLNLIDEEGNCGAVCIICKTLGLIIRGLQWSLHIFYDIKCFGQWPLTIGHIHKFHISIHSKIKMFAFYPSRYLTAIVLEFLAKFFQNFLLFEYIYIYGFESKQCNVAAWSIYTIDLN